MNPLCPGCLSEMSRVPASRNMFNCEPCREIIQFFDLAQHIDAVRRIRPSFEPRRPVRNVRPA